MKRSIRPCVRTACGNRDVPGTFYRGLSVSCIPKSESRLAYVRRTLRALDTVLPGVPEDDLVDVRALLHQSLRKAEALKHLDSSMSEYLSTASTMIRAQAQRLTDTVRGRGGGVS